MKSPLLSGVPGGSSQVAAKLESSLVKAVQRYGTQAAAGTLVQPTLETFRTASSWISGLDHNGTSANSQRLSTDLPEELFRALQVDRGSSIDVAQAIDTRGEESVLLGLYALTCMLESGFSGDEAKAWAEASATHLDGAQQLFGTPIHSTFHSLAKLAFDLNPDNTRLNLIHNNVTVNLNRGIQYKTEVKPNLEKVWFNLTLGKPLTEAQVRSAIALFDNGSNLDHVYSRHYSATSYIEEKMTLEEAFAYYMEHGKDFRSTRETPPAALFGKILNEPVEVPEHQWKILCISFDTFFADHPEFGHTQNSIILTRDGVQLGLVEVANLVHALSPALAKDFETKKDSELDRAEIISMFTAALSEASEISTVEDVLHRMILAPIPTIMVTDLDKMARFVSQLLGEDIRSVPYRVEAQF